MCLLSTFDIEGAMRYVLSLLINERNSCIILGKFGWIFLNTKNELELLQLSFFSPLDILSDSFIFWSVLQIFKPVYITSATFGNF